MKINIEDEEFNTGEKYDEGEFEKVPIENQTQPIEIFNTDTNNVYNSFKTKFKNKSYILILIFLIFILFFISKRMIFNIKLNNNIINEVNTSNLTNNKNNSTEVNNFTKVKKEKINNNIEKNKNILDHNNTINTTETNDKKIEENNETSNIEVDEIINEDNNQINKNENIKEDLNEFFKTKKDNENLFFINQDKEKINMKSFSSAELRNPHNIKLIEYLEISLDIEYNNFLHLKIKDALDKRWEVPENDVLDKNYLENKNKNKISLSQNLTSVESSLFNIELFSSSNNNTNNSMINEDFSFKITNNKNLEFYSFTTTRNFLYSDTYINFESKLTSDNIYGFGERTHDFKLDNRLYTIWPYDCGGTQYDDGYGGMNEYSHQPIGLHKTKYENLWLGLVFLNTNAQDILIKTLNENNNTNTYLTHKTIGGIIDYYIIINNSPEEVVKNIQFLLGIPPLPPFWSLGYHQSRYGYKNFNEFKNVYEKYKQLNIPIDTMWIDIDSLDNFEIFTIDRKFRDMPKYVKNIIHRDGGKFVPIVDLGISYENMRNPYIRLGNELDIFIKSNYTKGPLIGKVWPGKTVFPDFLNPKIKTFWFKGLDNYYKLIEYDGIWLDMNEPANLLEHSFCIGEIANIKDCTKDKNKFDKDKLAYFPGGKIDISRKSISENAIVYNNNVIYDVKPLISYYQTKYTFEYLHYKLNKRPFVLSRSTTIGSGKYTFHWLGDNFSRYENIKNSISGIFNFNIFGIPFTGSDICGFMNNANKHLCIRWYNLGVFYPFSRNHNFFNTIDQYPWSFRTNINEEYDPVNIIRKDLNYRYSLIRYMYSQFFLISLNEKGSFFKPLMFEFPEEKTSYEDIESKIMFGEAFLICAFYERNEGIKNFYLPNSNFNEYPSGKSILNYGEENRIIDLYGKLDRIYIFLRGGFIVPIQNTFDKFILNSEKLRNEKLNLIINPNEFNESKGEIFFDNDDINTINNKNFYRIDMSFKDNKLDIICNKNNINKYNYNDHIMGKIEIWRANELFEFNNKQDNKTKIINLDIFYINKDKENDNFEGIYEEENNKIIFDLSNNVKAISIFDIKEILFNSI